MHINREVRMTQAGFTLVELMIVVAIIGVLSVVAGTAYRKYVNKARSAEVYAMFGEIRSKQEGYRAENSVYCNTAATCATTANEDTVYPALLATGEPKPKATWRRRPWPAGWTALGISAGKSAAVLRLRRGRRCRRHRSLGRGHARPAAVERRRSPRNAWWYASRASATTTATARCAQRIRHRDQHDRGGRA